MSILGVRWSSLRRAKSKTNNWFRLQSSKHISSRLQAASSELTKYPHLAPTRLPGQRCPAFPKQTPLGGWSFVQRRGECILSIGFSKTWLRLVHKWCARTSHRGFDPKEEVCTAHLVCVHNVQALQWTRPNNTAKANYTRLNISFKPVIQLSHFVTLNNKCIYV